jgi:hypothetical protein
LEIQKPQPKYAHIPKNHICKWEEILCRVKRSFKDRPNMHLKNRFEVRSSKDHPNKHPKELSTNLSA